MTLSAITRIYNTETKLIKAQSIPLFTPALPLEREFGKQIYQTLQGPVVETILKTAKDDSSDDYWRSRIEGH